MTALLSVTDSRSAGANCLIVFGMTLYNNAPFLRHTLESLQNQSHGDFAVVMLDDCSSDQTSQIASEFSVTDSRFVYICNDSRLGMLGTWRKVFDLATLHYPSMRYFAWASDHDIWDSTWLEKLISVLESSNQTVMAYPLTQRIDQNGNFIEHNVLKGKFSTSKCRGVVERFRVVTELRRNFGNMVYGLYRASALRSAGTYRDVVIPDRLLMQELCLHGDIAQIEEVLWFRRFRKQITLQSQIKSLWARKRPVSSYFPWELVHSIILFRHLLWLLPFQNGWRGKFYIALIQIKFSLNNMISRIFLGQKLNKMIQKLRKSFN